MPSVCRRDVDELSHLAQALRRAAGAMGNAATPVNDLVAGVDQQIGGAATGKDREFRQFLGGAQQGINAAIAAGQDAARAVERAASEAAEDVRAQERREQESRRVQT